MQALTSIDLKIKAAVIDDERLARMRLSRLLNEIGVDVIADGKSGRDAILAAKTPEVDLLLLDINMPQMTGIEAARAISELGDAAPSIIFCTAYAEHAVDAFATEAVAYLLKPVSKGSLIQAIEKATKLNRLQQLNVHASAATQPKLVSSALGAKESLDFESILFFYSEDKLVFAKTVEGLSIMVDKTLKQLEAEFENYLLRVHRATLVNRSKMKRLFRDESGCTKLQMSEGAESDIAQSEVVLVSRRHTALVKKCFDEM